MLQASWTVTRGGVMIVFTSRNIDNIMPMQTKSDTINSVKVSTLRAKAKSLWSFEIG
jgi:hypothetical protein